MPAAIDVACQVKTSAEPVGAAEGIRVGVADGTLDGSPEGALVGMAEGVALAAEQKFTCSSIVNSIPNNRRQRETAGRTLPPCDLVVVAIVCDMFKALHCGGRHSCGLHGETSETDGEKDAAGRIS